MPPAKDAAPTRHRPDPFAPLRRVRPSPVERTFALYGGVVLDLAIAVPEFAEIEPLVIAHLGRWAVAQARATGQAFRFHPDPLRIPPRPSQRSSS